AELARFAVWYFDERPPVEIDEIRQLVILQVAVIEIPLLREHRDRVLVAIRASVACAHGFLPGDLLENPRALADVVPLLVLAQLHHADIHAVGVVRHLPPHAGQLPNHVGMLLPKAAADDHREGNAKLFDVLGDPVHADHSTKVRAGHTIG